MTSFKVPPECTAVAFLSDVHANLPALEAVLSELSSDVLVVCLGDLVGYYVHPDEVCRLAMARASVSIRGNHEAYLLGELAYAESRESLYRMAWTNDVLSPEVIAWLRTLPTELNLEFDRGGLRAARSIKLRHANLFDETCYIYPDTPLPAEYLNGVGVLAVGHTHHPMVRRVGEGILFNPGSVGQPRDHRPGACYGLLDTRSGVLEFRRAAYDVGAYQTLLSQLGVDSRAISLLSRTSSSARPPPAPFKLW